MSALRLLFSSDVFLPRGYTLGWEPVLLVADAASQLLLGAGSAALLFRTLRRSKRTETQAPPGDGSSPAATSPGPRGLGLFGALLCLSALVETIGLWRFYPGVSALLRGAAGCVALFACRAARASAGR